jgi:hypothetical protein
MKKTRGVSYEPIDYWGDIVGSVYEDEDGVHFIPAVPYKYYDLLKDLRNTYFPDHDTLEVMLECRLYMTEDVRRKEEELDRRLKEEEETWEAHCSLLRLLSLYATKRARTGS